jgi:hypothetical protein
MLLGLLLVAFVAVMAQQTGQTGEQKKQADACCAMDSCCCKGESCAMKKEGTETAAAKDGCCGDSCKLHHENAKNNETAKNSNNETVKNDAAHEGCCGQSCCGESCDMSKHQNHDKKTHSPDGSCCKMKQKDAKKQAKSN